METTYVAALTLMKKENLLDKFAGVDVRDGDALGQFSAEDLVFNQSVLKLLDAFVIGGGREYEQQTVPEVHGGCEDKG